MPRQKRSRGVRVATGKAAAATPGALPLGAPWKGDDAIAICGRLTGVHAALCRPSAGSGGVASWMRADPAAGGVECRRAAAAQMPALVRAPDTPRRYACPKGLPCACLAVAGRAPCDRFLWLRACRIYGREAAACDRAAAAGETVPASVSDEAFDTAVLLLAAMACRALPDGTHPAPSRLPAPSVTQTDQVCQVCRRVHERYADHRLRLRSLAEEIGVGLVHLCTTFSRAVGVPFRSYLNAWRLHKARELLVEGRLSIKEVAGQTGYGDANRLRLDFKDAYGLAPRPWREEALRRVFRDRLPQATTASK
jgi:AraC-like DNA-binding protein